MNRRETIAYLALAFLSSPVIHVVFSFFLGWKDYMPFIEVPAMCRACISSPRDPIVGATCGSCEHDFCAEGPLDTPFNALCDECVSMICQVDPFCCETDWDSVCVGEVTSVCGLTCP